MRQASVHGNGTVQPRSPAGPALIQAYLEAFRAALDDAWGDAELPVHTARALGCIHRHLFDEELNVAFVRAACGLRNHNISCRFKHHIGLGMRRYIEVQRLRAAEGLLRMGGVNITEVAVAVGYAYLESFERAFRRCEGCTPTEFQARPLSDRSEGYGDETIRRSVKMSG